MWFAPAISSSAPTSSACARRLSQIRDMSKDELKALYKEQLRAEPEEGSKGPASASWKSRAARRSRSSSISPDFGDSRVLRPQGYHLKASDRCETSSTFRPPSRTPAVDFDFVQNRLKIAGESYPEDVTEFYGPVFAALDAYLGELGGGSCRFDFELIYLNSIEREGDHDADG